MKKPYITLEEALAAREEGRRSVKLLSASICCFSRSFKGVTLF